MYYFEGKQGYYYCLFGGVLVHVTSFAKDSVDVYDQIDDEEGYYKRLLSFNIHYPLAIEGAIAQQQD